jgi:hypothetical protein
MAKKYPNTPEATRHKAFIVGAMSGTPDVEIQVGCNPPLMPEPSQDEIARRMNRNLGDVSTTPANGAVMSREDRIQALKDTANTASGASSLRKSRLDDAINTKGY